MKKLTSKLAASRLKAPVSVVCFPHKMPLEGPQLNFWKRKPPSLYTYHKGDPLSFHHMLLLTHVTAWRKPSDTQRARAASQLATEGWKPPATLFGLWCKVPTASSCKEQNQKAWAPQERPRGASLPQKARYHQQPLKREEGHKKILRLCWVWLRRQKHQTLQRYILQTDLLWPRLSCTQALTNSEGIFIVLL